MSKSTKVITNPDFSIDSTVYRDEAISQFSSGNNLEIASFVRRTLSKGLLWSFGEDSLAMAAIFACCEPLRDKINKPSSFSSS